MVFWAAAVVLESPLEVTYLKPPIIIISTAAKPAIKLSILIALVKIPFGPKIGLSAAASLSPLPASSQKAGLSTAFGLSQTGLVTSTACTVRGANIKPTDRNSPNNSFFISSLDPPQYKKYNQLGT